MREEFEKWFQEEVVEAKVVSPLVECDEYTEGNEYEPEFYTMLQAMWMAFRAGYKVSHEN